MLEKPDLPDEVIRTCLQTAYGLSVTDIVFLPLGADLKTAVYRAIASDQRPYFVKLRRGAFNETAVTYPQFLHQQGVSQIIPAISTQTGQLWANLEGFTLILYPFVQGKHGYEQDLSDQQWRDLGTALKRVHTIPRPVSFKAHFPQETYTAYWRERVKMFVEHQAEFILAEPVSTELGLFLKAKEDEILHLVQHTEQLAQRLVRQAPEFVVCHADIHAGNVLLDSHNTLFIVDWDTLILAPKERDLMYVGGGQFGSHRTPQEEAALFYGGYGPAEVDPLAVAYYRYERIIQDIAVECEQIFLSHDGLEDRIQALRYLKANFLPNHVLEIASQTDPTIGS